MANYYDPNGMRTVAGSLKTQIAQFRSARIDIETIVKSVGASWDDDVNRKFYQTYMTSGAVKAEQLEKLMDKYQSLLSECARRYGSAIDHGNTFLTSF